MTDPTVLSVEGYTLDLATDAGLLHVLQDVGFSIGRGEVLGLVGESGSGKTTLAYAIMRHLPPVARERSGVIRLGGDDLTAMPEREVERLRGRRIGMVFQDPGTSLNPTMRLGDQVAEVLIRHRGLDRTAAWREGEAMLERVGLKTPGAMMHRYPHEVSGGEKQRVVIAAAFACRPECILFDEPTTALDVITAQQILELFRDLQAETGVASLYISHDLALVSKIAHRVAVIHRGRIVEEDPADQIFSAPRQDYTRRLIASVPRPDHRLVDNGPPAPEPDLIRVDGMTVRYGTPPLLGRLTGRSDTVIGARSVSFGLASGEILGVVGESGSGKSTIAKAMVGLNPFEGNIAYGGRRISGRAAMDKSYRRDVQVVFQHPDSSLNPRQRIGDILARPLRLYGVDGTGGVKAQIARLLEDVQLPPEFAQRYPHQLSGGEKQRVAIARAFASRPRLVICDEITSALDVSIQAAVVKLLLSLRERYGTAYLFITHDLNLVRQIAHRVLVMYRGDLVETASSTELARGPSHAYTRALLDAVPTPVG